MPEVQPTNNPVPSDHPADARDNFKRIDEVVNLQAAQTNPTRTGKRLNTLFGIESNYIASPINGGVWASGVTFTAYNQYMAFNGVSYKPSFSTPLPYETQGSDPTLNPDSNFVEPFSEINSTNISDYTDIVYKDSGGNSAVENMIAGIPSEASESSKLTTTQGGYSLEWSVSSSAQSGRYSIQLDSGLYAALDSQEVEIFGLGVNSGDDISQIMLDMSTAENVRKIKASGLDSVEMSLVVPWSRDDVFIKLPVTTWTGDYDLYPGGSSTRQVGIFTVTGTRDTLTPLSISADISEGDATYTVSATTGLTEGGFAVMIGGPRFNYLTRVAKISGNQVTLDYASGWDELAGVVDLYSAEPVKNVHVMIDKIVDASGSTIESNQVTGVTFLDSFQGSLHVGNAEDMANPVGLTRRAHTLYVPYMDNERPRYVDSGRGYTLQMSGSLFCATDVIKGTAVRHTMDWTRCAYCHSTSLYGTETAQIAVTAHGAYEHDITVDNIYTSKGCIGTLALANAGASFGERTKRFKINERVIINGQFDIQNAEDVEINGARVIESDFVRFNADLVLNDCDFSLGTSVRVRSRSDREQLTVTLNGGKFPDIELQNFSGSLRADNTVMKWFINQDLTILPRSIKTENCRHDIEATSALTVSETLSLSNPKIIVPATSSSIGVIAECPKLIITSADCENSPVISHDSSTAKSFIIKGLVDVDPNAARTAAVIRARNTNGLVANISGVISEYSGSGDIVEFGRADNSNVTLLMSSNYLNGDIDVLSFGSVSKSTIVGNMVRDLTDLPTNDANNGVAANVQI